MTPIDRKRGNERGAALFVVILLTALLCCLAAVGTRSSQLELMIAGNDFLTKQALEVADAGISHAVSLLRQTDASGLNAASNGFNDELSNGGTGGALAAMGTAATLDGLNYRFVPFGGKPTDGYYVRAIDNFDETDRADDPLTDRDGKIVLVSRGRVGRAERIIQVTIQSDPVVSCLLCGNVDFPILPVDVALVGAFRADSFNSNLGTYNIATAGAAGNIFTNGDISLITDPFGILPIDVHGDLTAARTILKIGTVNVSGTTTSLAPRREFPPVTPCGPPYPTNSGISGGLYNQATGLLINVGINDVIDLAPGDYCFSAITMAGLSQLRVGGPVRIYLTLPSTIAGINNTTGLARNLQIFSSVASPIPLVPTIPGLTIVGATQAAMLIYAPMSIVTFAGLTDFYGAVVAGTIPNAGVTRLHYDSALNTPGLRVLSWREIRNYIPS